MLTFDREDFERWCEERGLVVPTADTDDATIRSLVSWYVVERHEQEDAPADPDRRLLP